MRLFTLERVAADQFSETVGLMRGRAPGGAHLVKHNVCARFRRLKSSFAAGETSAYDLNPIQLTILERLAVFAERITERI